MTISRLTKGKSWENSENRSDIIIKPTDKGSTVVVLSKDDYIKEAERQLNNHAHYQKLNADPTLGYASVIKKYVESMFSRRQIDKRN